MSTDLTLYAIETDLQALMDTEEMVPDDQLAEFQAALVAKGEQALNKRDACIRAFQSIEAQIEFCKRERERLADRQKRLEGGAKRFRRYLAGVMEATGAKKLEGRIGTIGYRRGTASVEVIDAAKVPDAVQLVEVVMSAQDWNLLGRILESNREYWDSLRALHPVWLEADREKSTKFVVPTQKALREWVTAELAAITAPLHDRLSAAESDEERHGIILQIADASAQWQHAHGIRLIEGEPTVQVK